MSQPVVLCVRRNGAPLAAALALLLFLPLGLAQDGPAGGGELAARLEAIEATGARVGVLAVSLEDGKVVYQHRADELFIPASIIKLLVATSALVNLKPDYRFPLEALAATDPVQGVLAGDLILRGHGDPALSAEEIRRLAREVRGRGVQRVAGGVIADDSLLDPRGGRFAELGGLSVSGGAVAVEVRPGKAVGRPAVIVPGEGAGSLSVLNLTTTAARSRSTLRARVRGSRIEVSGRQPLRARPVVLRARLENPSLHAALLFADALRQAGVAVQGGASVGRAPAGARQVAHADGSSLASVLAHMLEHSDNLYAEQLLLVLGAAIDPPGTSAKGIAAVCRTMEGMGLSLSGMTVVDACGLSKSNRLHPRFLVDLLTRSWQRPEIRSVLLAGLPDAGATGTLRKRYRHANLAGDVRAKTGWLWGVGTLAGYYWTSDNKPYVFAVLLNERPGRGYRAVAETVDGIVLDLMTRSSGSEAAPLADSHPPVEQASRSHRASSRASD